MERKDKEERILKLLDELLKDTDSIELKERVRRFLREQTDVYTVAVAGDTGVGKSSFIQQAFLGGGMGRPSGKELMEYRYGEENAIFSPEQGYVRQFVPDNKLKGLSILEIPGTDGYRGGIAGEAVKRANSIFALMDADEIQNPYIWDLIERNREDKSLVCVITKADQCPKGQLEEKKEKVMRYLKEARTQAPVFAVSAVIQEEGAIEGGFEEIFQYIEHHINGSSTLRQKQRQNFDEAAAIVRDLKDSFEKRMTQYKRDKQILNEIDRQMDQLRMEQRENIQALQDQIGEVISDELSIYEKTVLSALNPRKIKSNFTDKDACLDWLRTKVEICEKNLNTRIMNKTNDLFRGYIRKLKNIYEEALTNMENRKLYLDAEDQFYGTLSAGKAEVGRRLENTARSNCQYYLKLSEASNELLEKMWDAKSRCETGKEFTTTAGAGIGFTAGVLGKATAAAAAKGAVTFSSIISGISLSAVITGVVAGVVLYEVGKKLADSYFSQNMDKEAGSQTEAFKKRVEDIRQDMTGQVKQRIADLFGEEIDSIDKSFMEFRMSVNIDEKNIPALESKLREALELIDSDNTASL